MTIIKDPLLEPFYIGKDAHCYTVYEVITPQKKYLEKGSKGLDYEKPVGHFSDFGAALKSVMKAQLNQTDKVYNNVQTYIAEWVKIRDKITKLVSIEDNINQ